MKEVRKRIHPARYLLVFTALLAFFSGCAVGAEEKVTEVFDLENLSRDCLAVADMCRDAHNAAAESGNTKAEKIEKCLIENGCMVVSQYQGKPAYLANSEKLFAFCEAENMGKNASASIIQVNEKGDFHYGVFQFLDGERYYHTFHVQWDEQGEPYIAEQYELPVYGWELTENGNFFYQLRRSDIHGADHSRLRLQPVDEEKQALAEKYILPVGYIQNNLFFTDWSEEDVSQLRFADAFGFLYEMAKKEAFDKYLFPYDPDGCYYRIPAELFEETILEFFDVSPDQIREEMAGDGEKTYYPYAGLYLDYSGTPDLYPDIRDCTYNGDGTVTLTVWVESMEMGTECLFSHELTVRPLESSDFQYVSNRITSAPEDGLPIPKSRIAYNQSTGGRYEIHVGGTQQKRLMD